VDEVSWGDGRFFTLIEASVPSTPITTIFLPPPSCMILQLVMKQTEDRKEGNTSLKPISLTNLTPTLTTTHSFMKDEELEGIENDFLEDVVWEEEENGE